MNLHENKLINEIEELRTNFHVMTEKLVKDIKRQDKIMLRSDKRQRQEYDELQVKLHQVEKLQVAQKDLLDSFIYLMASAIDEKSTHTGAHCTRVPELSLMIADIAHHCDDGIFKDFIIENEDQKREISIASWLHDCGKVTTPEYVVDKATKLETITNRIHEIRTRFEVIHRDKTIEALNRKLDGEDASVVDLWLEEEYLRLQKEFQILADANIGSEYMGDDIKKRIQEISVQTWVRNFDDSLGLAVEEKKRVLSENSTTPQVEKLLDDKLRHIIPREDFDYKEYEQMGFKTEVPDNLYNFGEVYNLTISAGTLSYEERFKIQEHVHMTIKMLQKLPFPEHLKNVPLYAGAHHETLIGTGYPRKLSAEDMPIASRIMAIADIFEALTASDRPYKEAKTLSQSIEIMASMVKRQHIDSDIFKLFLENDLHIIYAEKYLDKKQIDVVDISKYIQ
ncbi:hypothetical protein OAR97_01325 [Arcobacteraceae bacterium]|nr:hypothetical protein [Arcobacteraceae bacterium]